MERVIMDGGLLYFKINKAQNQVRKLTEDLLVLKITGDKYRKGIEKLLKEAEQSPVWGRYSSTVQMSPWVEDVVGAFGMAFLAYRGRPEGDADTIHNQVNRLVKFTDRKRK